MEYASLEAFMRSGRFYRRRKGQNIQSASESDAFYLLTKGYVKRYLISREGSLGVQSIYGPGSFFPLTPAFEVLFGQRIYEGKETYYYEAVTDAELYSAGRTALLEAAEANPSLYKDVLREAGRRLQSNIQQLENIALKSAYYRLAHQLVYLARQFGEAGGDGIALCIPLTHQDLADILSLSRETVSREMAKLREHGLVAADSELIIPDLARLQAVYS